VIIISGAEIMKRVSLAIAPGLFCILAASSAQARGGVQLGINLGCCGYLYRPQQKYPDFRQGALT